MIRILSADQIRAIVEAYLKEKYGQDYTSTYLFVATGPDGHDALDRYQRPIILGGRSLPFVLEFSINKSGEGRANELGHKPAPTLALNDQRFNDSGKQQIGFAQTEGVA